MDVVTLGQARALLRGNSGYLRNRPAAVGSMRTYYATNDCGGTLHQDIAPGVWRRVHARGEIASVISNPYANWYKATTLTGILALFLEITTDEPRAVDVILQGGVQVGTASETIAATDFARLSVTENGTNLGSDYYYPGAGAALGSQRNLRLSLRRNLIPGTLYTYQAYYGSGSTTASVRSVAGMELKVVEL